MKFQCREFYLAIKFKNKIASLFQKRNIAPINLQFQSPMIFKRMKNF